MDVSDDPGARGGYLELYHGGGIGFRRRQEDGKHEGRREGWLLVVGGLVKL